MPNGDGQLSRTAIPRTCSAMLRRSGRGLVPHREDVSAIKAKTDLAVSRRGRGHGVMSAALGTRKGLIGVLGLEVLRHRIVGGKTHA